jgi:phosphoribosylformimino-5-aminoimidazole carboxamide ribotide isomerase
MIIYPAIDLKDGRAVRLEKGDALRIKDYGAPIEAALRWKQAGAHHLHVVDLDGAFEGTGKNTRHVRDIISQTGLEVQLGGGIRDIATIRRLIEEVGVSRLILGTAAVENQRLVEEAAGLYPGQIACGLDARNGLVATRGWVKDSGLDALAVALELKSLGIQDLIYTDISRDGMLSGANIEATRHMALHSGMRVIGSGGVAALSDVSLLRDAGCAGAILGKAIYEGRFTVEEALALAGVTA